MSTSRVVQTFALEAPVLGLTSMTAEADCAPCQQRASQSTSNPDNLASTAPADPLPPAELSSRWAGVIGVEGEMTGDGRLIEPNALRWENLPLPLRYVASDMGAHDGAVVVGHIDSIERRDGGVLWGTGDFDLDSPEGREASRVVGRQLCNGVSMDLDDVSFEVRVAAELLEDEDGGMGIGLLLSADDPEDPETIVAEQQTDDDGRVTVMEIGADDEVRVTTDGRVRAATIVSIPAFASALIEWVEGPASPVEAEMDDELVAGGGPLAPPAAWFSRPPHTGPTPLSITPDGRISGHLAGWNTCHISHTSAGKCVLAPRSPSGYAYFHQGTVLTAEGAEIPVGHITLDTTHAGEHLSAASTAAHYEHTGHVVADVAAGEDEWGVWVAGAVRPGTTDLQLRALRAAPLSGDWRRIGTDLELVAALSVNVPGFPVPRPKGLVAGGVVRSLVAAGMLPPRRVRRPGAEGALSAADLRYLKRLAARERAEEQTLQASGTLPDATEMARRVRASALVMRVHRR